MKVIHSQNDEYKALGNSLFHCIYRIIESSERGENNWKQLPDEVFKRLKVAPAVYTVEEHHAAVYAGKDNQTIVKADRPKSLLRNSIATPSLVANVTRIHQSFFTSIKRLGKVSIRRDS